jgi:hypothetical protein
VFFAWASEFFLIPPSPLGSIGITGLARNSSQNPDVKELSY